MWCEPHLGSPAESELFRTGHLTRVIGALLADGRAIVVRIRPAVPRLTACTQVQRRPFDSGYPCPRPLAGLAPLDEYEATAESHLPAGAMLPDSGGAAQPLPQRSRTWPVWLPEPRRCPRSCPRRRGQHGTMAREGCGPGPRIWTWT